MLQKFIRVAGVTRMLRIMMLHRIFYVVRMSKSTALRKLPIAAPFGFMSLWGIKNNSSETTITSKEVLLAKADALFEHAEYQKIYDLLQNYKDQGDVEILWRLCRALYNMSLTASDVETKRMIYEAYDLATRALSINENHYAVHKWNAVLLDSKSNYEGKKSRIQQLQNVKNHMLRAVELNPKDATTLYMLGCWCYQVTDLSWYQRKIASAIFDTPPNSSFDEALQFFERAEKIDPNFYSHNLLMLGKTYLKLNRIEDARKYLKMASEFPARNDDDIKAKQEATKLLSSL